MWIGPTNKAYVVMLDDEHMYVSDFETASMKMSISEKVEISGFLGKTKIYPLAKPDINITTDDVMDVISLENN